MNLGQFSLSLSVKDIEKSLAFYELFGLKVIDGGHMNQAYPDTPTEKWRILQHESVVIGLFQGVFEKNMLTFNPQDVRAIQKALKKAGVALTQEADENTTGPASIMLEDPDGNPILFDQF
jgi:catechol 2,3-dioxygenase-like lactoylglutathione lyase family enzyme